MLCGMSTGYRGGMPPLEFDVLPIGEVALELLFSGGC